MENIPTRDYGSKINVNSYVFALFHYPPASLFYKSERVLGQIFFSNGISAKFQNWSFVKYPIQKRLGSGNCWSPALLWLIILFTILEPNVSIFI